MSLPEQFLNGSDKTDLDPADKELFLKTWDLEDGEMTDLEILIAIKTGQL